MNESKAKSRNPIKENAPQEETGQEAQEVTENVPLYYTKTLDEMTPEELQTAIVETLLRVNLYTATTDAARQQAQEAANRIEKIIAAVQQPDILKAVLLSTVDVTTGFLQLADAARAIQTFYISGGYKAMRETIQGFSEWYNTLTQQISFSNVSGLIELTKNLQILAPYIQEETAAYKKETGKDQITAKEFFRDTDPETGEPIESIYSRALQRARERAQIEALPRYEEIGGLPAKYVMPNDPLTNSLIGRYDKKAETLLPTINAGAFDLPFMDSGKPTETTAYTIITLAEEYTKNLETLFAPDELSILYGVISILSTGRESFTAEEVLRTIRPKGNTGDSRKKTVEKIDKTIIKLCNMPIKSNLTPILQRIASDNRRQLPLGEDGAPLTEYELNESVLMLTPATMKYGSGKVISGYSVVYNKNGSVHEPQIMTVARMLGQIIQTDIDNMAIQEVKSGKLLPGSYIELTWGRTTIRDYLYRRIAIMKNDQKNKRKRQSHTILFETLYTYTGAIKGSKTEKTDKKRTREFALACLDYWKVKGIIKDYNIEMQGRQYRSIEIVLPKVQEK